VLSRNYATVSVIRIQDSRIVPGGAALEATTTIPLAKVFYSLAVIKLMQVRQGNVSDRPLTAMEDAY
jgi:hypothetical protein